jgi:hypothetical protein
MSKVENVVDGKAEEENAEKESILIESAKFRDECMVRFMEKARVKYDKGQKEHGGLLPLDVRMNDLEDEVIDQWFYLQAIKTKINNLCPEKEVEFYGKRKSADS